MDVAFVEVLDEEGFDRRVLRRSTAAELGVVPGALDLVTLDGRQMQVVSLTVDYDVNGAVVVVEEFTEDDKAQAAERDARIRYRDDEPG